MHAEQINRFGVKQVKTNMLVKMSPLGTYNYRNAGYKLQQSLKIYFCGFYRFLGFSKFDFYLFLAI